MRWLARVCQAGKTVDGRILTEQNLKAVAPMFDDVPIYFGHEPRANPAEVGVTVAAAFADGGIWVSIFPYEQLETLAANVAKAGGKGIPLSMHVEQQEDDDEGVIIITGVFSVDVVEDAAAHGMIPFKDGKPIPAPASLSKSTGPNGVPTTTPKPARPASTTRPKAESLREVAPGRYIGGGGVRDYTSGILVRVIEAGTSGSGRTYPESVLMEAERFIGPKRGVIACYLGHQRPGVRAGHVVGLEYHDKALWGCLAGADPGELMAMHEGALAAGRPTLGVSINARGVIDRTTDRVMTLGLLESIDLDSRREQAAAGGCVPFDEHGRPIAWEDRHAHWGRAKLAAEQRVLEAAERAVLAAQQRLLERQVARLQEAERIKRLPLVPIREDAGGGRLLAPIR